MAGAEAACGRRPAAAHLPEPKEFALGLTVGSPNGPGTDEHYGRHRRWSADGTWARIADALRIDADTGEAKDLTASVDSSSARVHQHAAGTRRRAPKETDGKGCR